MSFGTGTKRSVRKYHMTIREKTIKERKREIVLEDRRLRDIRRDWERCWRECFWTWPWGHRWDTSSPRRSEWKCLVCEKPAPSHWSSTA